MPPLAHRLRQRAQTSAAAARNVWPGVLTALTIATAAVFVSSRYGGPALVFALLLGMAFNFLRDDDRVRPGIEFTAKRVLRLGVALLGARIGVDQILNLGWTAIAVIVAMVPLTIFLGRLLARQLDQSPEMGVLTGGSVAICGASAALAIASVLPDSPRRERDTLFTVVGVTTLSTICMVIYPAVLSLFQMTDMQAGYIIGASVHDVAQVVGAGYVISEEAGDAATLTKLIRVAMLIPTTLILATLYAGQAAGRPGGQRAAVQVPGFLIGFVVLAVLTNLSFLPQLLIQVADTTSRWCLVTAIAALGVKTVLRELVDLGWRPVILMVVETLVLVLAVAGLVLLGDTLLVDG